MLQNKWYKENISLFTRVTLIKQIEEIIQEIEKTSFQDKNCKDSMQKVNRKLEFLQQEVLCHLNKTISNSKKDNGLFAQVK